MFEIESGIPVAVSARGRKPTAFPLAHMDVGDSFLIECDTNSKKVLDSWRRKLLVARKRLDPDLQLRTAVVDGGLRVWRTA